MSRQQERSSYLNRNTGKYAGRTGAYVEGNTVRKLNVMPQRVPEERNERRVKPDISHQTRKNQERAMQMSLGYVLFLTVAVLITVGVCALYLQMQSENSIKRKNIASLESQILELRTDNDAAYNRIETSINMEEIKNTAMNEMGMVYPSEDQIIYFSVETNDYMNLYQDIPE